MRDPDLVQRAERAATALEQAWMSWSERHGLGAGPLAPVSSYVGYSLEEPWGQPRVVLGIDADGAERLAAILEGHECVGPVYAGITSRPERRQQAEAPGPIAGWRALDSRPGIPAQQPRPALAHLAATEQLAAQPDGAAPVPAEPAAAAPVPAQAVVTGPESNVTRPESTRSPVAEPADEAQEAAAGKPALPVSANGRADSADEPPAGSQPGIVAFGPRATAPSGEDSQASIQVRSPAPDQETDGPGPAADQPAAAETPPDRPDEGQLATASARLVPVSKLNRTRWQGPAGPAAGDRQKAATDTAV
jgi:hypothetical protein